MNDAIKIGRIQIILCILFVICKAWLRPFVLDRDFNIVFDIIVLSLPNFFEGIVGVLTITIVGLYLHNRFFKKERKFKPTSIYLIATLLAAIFVLTQEFKIHNLGGNNVYDPYDVVFSLIGLSVGYVLTLKIRPNIGATDHK